MIKHERLEADQIRQTLTQCISKASDLHTALCVVLMQVCEVIGWDYGEAWIPSQERMILELSLAWYINPGKDSIYASALEQFRLCSEAFVLPPAIGLPGRVWSSQQPEWIVDVAAESETYFLRNQIAKAYGVKAGFGVPIIANHQVVAVLVFFMLEACEENKQLMEVVWAIANELGEVLQQSRLVSG